MGLDGSGLTHRQLAYFMTDGEQEGRAETSLERQAERRKLRGRPVGGKYPADRRPAELAFQPSARDEQRGPLWCSTI